jgi:hypothetical protein
LGWLVFEARYISIDQPWYDECPAGDLNDTNKGPHQVGAGNANLGEAARADFPGEKETPECLLKEPTRESEAPMPELCS